MPISEEKALEILTELIKKPETRSEEIPRIWGEIMSVYNAQFAPAEEPKKKKRRRAGAPSAGWPAGVSREEYKRWKEARQAAGETENLSPQTYKQLREAGMLEAPAGNGKKAPARKAKAE